MGIYIYLYLYCILLVDETLSIEHAHQRKGVTLKRTGFNGHLKLGSILGPGALDDQTQNVFQRVQA